eukprot:1160425-Pelagomonas_calceolata.AAC.8
MLAGIEIQEMMVPGDSLMFYIATKLWMVLDMQPLLHDAVCTEELVRMHLAFSTPCPCLQKRSPTLSFLAPPLYLPCSRVLSTPLAQGVLCTHLAQGVLCTPHAQQIF